MPNSMTGFGRAERTASGFAATVEVRSVNNRYLTVRASLPARFAALEPKIENEVRKVVGRGSVDVTVRCRFAASSEIPVVDLELARGWLRSIRGLAREAGLDGDVGLDTLLQLPGVVTLQEDAAAAARQGRVVIAALREALAELALMREREGRRLKDELARILDRAARALAAVEARAPKVPALARKRLRERLLKLGDAASLVEPSAIEREIALMADRCDVTEEVARLRSHMDGFSKDLERKGPIGRRLEFVVQEMAREANTIASKSQDATLSRRVIDLRAEVERMREQVQNVE